MKYKLLDSGNFEKLEQVGPYRLRRPALQAAWSPLLPDSEWQQCDAHFKSSPNNRGQWSGEDRIKAPVEVNLGGIRLWLSLTPFGHIGVFPEQEDNWCILSELSQRPQMKVLNLFAYTGGSSLAAALAGAHVTHVDASKTTVEWAKKNAQLNSIANNSIRWIVDDVSKFVAREVRRGSKYQGIILDPPSYGRGPKGQVWKIEDNLQELMTNIKSLLAPDYSYLMLSCHSAGYSPQVLSNILQRLDVPDPQKRSRILQREMEVKDETGAVLPLPSGSCALLTSESDRP